VSMASEDGSARDADLVVGGGGRAFGGNWAGGGRGAGTGFVKYGD